MVEAGCAYEGREELCVPRFQEIALHNPTRECEEQRSRAFRAAAILLLSWEVKPHFSKPKEVLRELGYYSVWATQKTERG